MDTDQFDAEDSQELLDKLIAKATEGKHSEFEFIRSYDMLKVAKLYRRSTAKVCKMFLTARKAALLSYVDSIMTGNQKIEAILAIKKFEDCAEYYKKEHAIAKDMISEFKTYVMSGHILHIMLGGYRPENECVDYRRLP